MSEPQYYLHAYRARYSGDADEITTNAIINATYFAWFLQEKGWTINAICAALGNWEVETYLNPNYPQSSNFPEDQGGGFGMPHWTPWYNKIGQWALQRYGLRAQAADNNPLADFALQMEYHEYECTYGLDGLATWYPNQNYSYTWPEWKASTDDPQTLANAYYYQYERSASGSPGNRSQRAQKWFDYFAENPIPSSIPAWLLYQFNSTNLNRRRKRY